MTYTSEQIREVIAKEKDRLMVPWRAERPERWTPDSRSEAVMCLSGWLREELTKLGLSDEDRRIQENHFYRWSRSEDDLYQLAASIMNDAVSGNILRDRTPHHRWG